MLDRHPHQARSPHDARLRHGAAKILAPGQTKSEEGPLQAGSLSAASGMRRVERQWRARPGSGSVSEALPVVDWLERVRGEYREMPGLCLTERQAQRLWGLDAPSCRALFDALLQSGFLRRTEQGCYVRIGA
jgi:hypothetical protein